MSDRGLQIYASDASVQSPLKYSSTATNSSELPPLYPVLPSDEQKLHPLSHETAQHSAPSSFPNDPAYQGEATGRPIHNPGIEGRYVDLVQGQHYEDHSSGYVRQAPNNSYNHRTPEVPRTEFDQRQGALEHQGNASYSSSRENAVNPVAYNYRHQEMSHLGYPPNASTQFEGTPRNSSFHQAGNPDAYNRQIEFRDYPSNSNPDMPYNSARVPFKSVLGATHENPDQKKWIEMQSEDHESSPAFKWGVEQKPKRMMYDYDFDEDYVDPPCYTYRQPANHYSSNQQINQFQAMHQKPTLELVNDQGKAMGHQNFGYNPSGDANAMTTFSSLPPPAQAQAPPVDQPNTESYTGLFALACIACWCCLWPVGLVAVIFAMFARGSRTQKSAQIMCIVSVVLSILSIVGGIVLLGVVLGVVCGGDASGCKSTSNTIYLRG